MRGRVGGKVASKLEYWGAVIITSTFVFVGSSWQHQRPREKQINFINLPVKIQCHGMFGGELKAHAGSWRVPREV